MSPLLHTRKQELGCSLQHRIQQVEEHSHASILRRLKPAIEIGVKTGTYERENILPEIKGMEKEPAQGILDQAVCWSQASSPQILFHLSAHQSRL